jgi:hypothetical protein
MGYFHRLFCFSSLIFLPSQCLFLSSFSVPYCVLLFVALSCFVLYCFVWSCDCLECIEPQMHILCCVVLFCLALPGLVLFLNDSGGRVILSLCPGVPGFGTHIGVKDSLTADEEGTPSPHPQRFPISRELSNTRIRVSFFVAAKALSLESTRRTMLIGTKLHSESRTHCKSSIQVFPLH